MTEGKQAVQQGTCWRSKAAGFSEAAAWIADAADRMPREGEARGWALGAEAFLRQRAEECARMEAAK